jgi:SPP1 gp7 family putative phage head morphogenesis protein
MKFTAWEARRNIENSYKTALRKLGRFLVGLIGDSDGVPEITDKFGAFADSEPFVAWAQSLAKTFVTHTLEENARTWRQAAAMSGQGSTIRKALDVEMQGPVGKRVNELIQQNAKYIKSVPSDVAQDLTRHVQSKAYEGSRVAYKSEEFKTLVGDMSNNHAKLISRTETSKAMSALTQARAERTGHDWFIWHTSEDQRVRDSHKHMDGVLCRFSDPPSPEALIGEQDVGKYLPGNIYNCRCFAEPVILWREVSWPRKVYANGSITTMGKKQFETQFNGGDAN